MILGGIKVLFPRKSVVAVKNTSATTAYKPIENDSAEVRILETFRHYKPHQNTQVNNTRTQS